MNLLWVSFLFDHAIQLKSGKLESYCTPEGWPTRTGQVFSNILFSCWFRTAFSGPWFSCEASWKCRCWRQWATQGAAALTKLQCGQVCWASRMWWMVWRDRLDRTLANLPGPLLPRISGTCSLRRTPAKKCAPALSTSIAQLREVTGLLNLDCVLGNVMNSLQTNIIRFTCALHHWFVMQSKSTIQNNSNCAK